MFWMAIGVYALIAIISMAYGFQYKFTSESLAMFFRLMTAPFFIVLSLLTIGNFGQWDRERVIAVAGYIGLCMMSLSFLMSCYFYSYKLPDISWVAVALPAITAASLLHIKWGSRGSTLGFLFFGFVLYTFFVIQTPHIDGANMLELIEAVLRDFYAGLNPYVIDYMPITSNKLGYMPALWLPYSIAYLADIDARVINMFCLLAIVVLFERALRGNQDTSFITSITIYPIILSPPVVQMVIHGHVLPYWLYLFVTAVALHKGRLLLASVMFGLALAARQPSVFLVPLLAIYVYNMTSMAGFIKYALASLLTYAAVVMPFAIWTGTEFWFQTYLNVAGVLYEDFLIHQINGSGILYALGLMDILNYIQLLIILAGAVVIARNSHKGASWFIFFSAIVYIWAVFFNIYVARYIYIPAIMLMSFAVATSMSVSMEPGKNRIKSTL